MAGDSLVPKIVAMCLMFAVPLFLGLLPIKLASMLKWEDGQMPSNRAQKITSGLSCLGAGIILTTCLSHMLPEVHAFLELNIQEGTLPDTGLPLAEILVLCGFLMIYLVEELGHFFLDLWKRKKEDQNVHNLTKTHHDHQHEPHDHEDLPLDLLTSKERSVQAAVRGFLIIFALSLHDLFEGIAIGITRQASYVWYLLFAFSTHKFIIAFCIGTRMVTSGQIKKLLIIIYMFIFAVISPIGIGIGIALTEAGTTAEDDPVQGRAITILHGLATGTLLYIVFFEVLEKERQKGTNGLVQVSGVILGFVLLVLLQLVEVSHGGLDGEAEVQVDIENIT